MDDIRLIIIPLEQHLIITVNKCASSTLIELIGEGNELFCSLQELPDIIAAHPDKSVVGIIREPYDRFASGLLEEVKRSIKLYSSLLNINRNELERIAQSDEFWVAATELYFEVQGVSVPNWNHSAMGYTAHCGNWLTVFDQISATDVKLVHMHNLNQFLADIGYTNVKTYNKTSDTDYVIRLQITVPDLNRRYAEKIIPLLKDYNFIMTHLADEKRIYNRLLARAGC